MLAASSRSGGTQWLEGSVVIITGAGSGIGAASALELARRGARPVLVDCDAAELAQACAAAGSDLLAIQADVTVPEDCQAMVRTVLQRYGRIDVVWANAGISSFGPLAHTDPRAWQRCIEVNVLGTFHTVRAALPEIMRSKGQVVVSASVSSFAHPPCVSAYAASKAAVEAMCNAWRIELAAHGVGVSIIHASWVRTSLTTEGNMHPGFRRLRATMPSVLNQDIEANHAAQLIADGISARARRIWVPGWVRLLHWLRPLLHTQWAERALRQAAPEIEDHFIDLMTTHGVAASSYPPRELNRSIETAAKASHKQRAD
jgi:NAD(P)-dependent dehydrogenase (short-subunit alcohol dehydrogenase family)